MDTSTTIGGAKPPTHQVPATREATANLIESEVTTQDAATPEGNAVDAQTVDIKVPSNPLGDHGAVDAVLHGERGTVRQAASTPHEASVPPAARQYSKLPGPREVVLGKNKSGAFKEFLVPVEAGHESSLEDIVERGKTLCHPWRGTPLPVHIEPYGTTSELFTEIKKTILEQTSLSNQVSAVLTYWSLSTWFFDSLAIAPCLVITGSSFEGDVVLRTLQTFCRFSFLMAGVTSAGLKDINWTGHPTLLLFDPNLTKSMAALLACSTSPGYMVGATNDYLDYFGPKAIYLGEDLPTFPIPRSSIHVNATAMSRVCPRYGRPLSDSIVQSFQNRLFDYRLKNMVRVRDSEFDASDLPPDTRAVANALGACIVDAPELQKELVSLLTPRAQQQLGDRSTSLEALAAEATLRLCHQGKLQIFVREIADEVNRIQTSRGETLKFTAEKVGHKLKKVGLYTRRLGSAGNGLLIDHTTRVHLHDVAASFVDAGFGHAENVHCFLCNENKGPMQTV